MLAHKWQDYEKKIKPPFYSQPKLDGIRCIARVDGLWTRKGEKINTCPHIEAIMVKVARRHDVILDGELYNHEFKNDFNKIQSLVTKKSVSPDEARQVRRHVEYHVYDLIDDSAAFGKRTKRLKEILHRELISESFIVPVHTICCDDLDALDRVYDNYLGRGYEGQMIRTDSKYERKRTKALLKRKEFEDAEFKIIDIEEGKGNKSGMVGSIVFDLGKEAKIDAGRWKGTAKSFSASLMGTDAYRRQVWKNKEDYLGLYATVLYQNLTPGGIPRFPRVKCIDEGK